MDDSTTAWAWPELLDEMTTRELTIVADTLAVADVLVDATLLELLATDSLLDLKLITRPARPGSTPPSQPCPRGRASAAAT